MADGFKDALGPETAAEAARPYLSLVDKVREEVLRQTGVELEMEVRILR